MITPQEFLQRWENEPPVDASADSDRRLVRPPESTLQSLSISEEARLFLREAGLPDSAAPFLSFRELELGAPRIYEFWGIPEQWSDDEKAYLKPFRVIGSDGSGNPICLDGSTPGRVALLDHDDKFATILFVNSSVLHLAEFLLAYREMVAESRLLAGSDAYLNGQIPPETLARTRETMEQIDPEALDEGTFWSAELQGVRS